MERFDRACDAFLESWTELAAQQLATTELENCIDHLSDAVDLVRLGMLVNPSDADSHSSGLKLAAELAKRCYEVCLVLANRQNPTGTT